ncbi:hypothetical protein BO94DRAFT_326079 [Aspergillus sclerotioniger CBS 115572]|uniref:Uncharacterized protein n=1 Tax=Aspergillus sclerotioniger CBS 115572 TaxID=1450535 RepID=A0A317XBC0_9EURO|nr:hypothetical protein BO94DRAFT_326079 [Aspergillus sclerotioniger CBS 115572]PWY94258.1 hypothetical protein BO94DRAFT_326079 [Aspergillus sclerotioniger CBS 115572]
MMIGNSPRRHPPRASDFCLVLDCIHIVVAQITFSSYHEIIQPIKVLSPRSHTPPMIAVAYVSPDLLLGLCTLRMLYRNSGMQPWYDLYEPRLSEQETTQGMARLHRRKTTHIMQIYKLNWTPYLTTSPPCSLAWWRNRGERQHANVMFLRPEADFASSGWVV